MKNLFLVLIISFYLQNCFLHSVSIESKTVMQKYSQSKIPSEKLKSIPVKVNFGKTKDERFVIILIDIATVYCGSKTTVHSQNSYSGVEIYKCNMEKVLKNNYFTEEYISKFQRSNSFYLSNNSNLRIEINAYPGKDGNQITSFFLFLFSLGIIPSKAYTYGTIHFDIFDSKKKEKINSFQYDIEHRFYEGVIPVLAGVILPLFSDRFDHSKKFNTYAIARVVYNEFEEDFLKEFQTNEKLQKAAYLSNPPIYKIQNPTKEEIAKNPYLPYFFSKLESKLLQRGIEIIKEDDSPNNRSSLKANQVIKVDSLNILKDSVNASISCLDLENNLEIWTEKISFPIKENITEPTLDKMIDKLIDNLVSKGEIN